MRNPERIPSVLAALQAAWEKTPDMRLGQLIVCLSSPNCDQNKIFQMEEGAWVAACTKWRAEQPHLPAAMQNEFVYWGTPYPKVGDQVGFISEACSAHVVTGIVHSGPSGRLYIHSDDDGVCYWPHACDKWKHR